MENKIIDFESTRTILRVVPEDFEDKLLVYLKDDFIECDSEESEKTIHALVERVCSLFIDIEQVNNKKKKENVTKVSAYTMFRRSKEKGDWRTMDEETKSRYRQLADEENIARGLKSPTKKIVKSESEKSYNVALKYLKKTYPNNLFKLWSELNEENKNIWSEFSETRLYCNMNNLLYNELICATAEKGKHMFIK